MASPSPSPSFLRQLQRYMSGALHRAAPLRMQPKPVAISVSVAVATATGFYQGQGRHGDGVAADGAASAHVSAQRGVKVDERSGAPVKWRPGDAGKGWLALAIMAMRKLRTPKEGEGGKGGHIHPPSS
ncbi:unnamed protein product [Urochloa decumbens]|uniref:Uncharacterized protein n=1 Tax=Urochloa decumbens TaxID=240449 RepID=A0ABC9HA59_9POAL